MANIPVSALVRSLMRDRQPKLHEPGQITRSAWTGKSKVLLLPGAAYWTFTLTFREVYTEVEARALRSFMSQLAGQSNTFDMPILPTPQFLTSRTNSAFPQGINSRGPMLVNGSPLTGYIKDGMYGTVVTTSGHKRLFIVNGDAAGDHSVIYSPAMSEIVQPNGVVDFVDPVARVRRSDPEWTYEEAMAYAGFSLDLEEAV